MKRLPNFLLMMLTTVLLATFIISCSESGSDSDPSTTPTQPQTPVAEGDWQVIPASGGTIEKGDISITFPSGTFSKDTKVAVTEMKKGEIGGDFEASKFYKVTMPVKTNKSLTIKVKSSEKGDDIRFVLRSPGYAESYYETVDVDSYLETTYSDGAYSSVLPPINNDEDIEEHLEITMGIAHLPQEVATTRGTTLIGGQVGNIKWDITYSLETLLKSTIDGGWKSKESKIETFKPLLNQFVEEAIKKIDGLGFKINEKERKIPIYIESNPDRWGQHVQSRISNSRSTISVFYEKMLDSKPDTAGLRCTIIHELFHYFQAEYDPRCAFKIGGGMLNMAYGDEFILYEMGAVWAEQFMNGGQLNSDFLSTQALHNVFYVKGQTSMDILGIGNESERWASTKKYKYYSDQGYSMAPMLYYLTTQTTEFSNKSVLELHQLFKEKWKSGWFYFTLDEWAKNNNSNFFSSYTNIDDYYMKLWKGSLVKNFCITNILDDVNTYAFKNADRKHQISGTLHPFGCAARMFPFRDFKDISLENKEFVVKQLDENAHSYLIVTNANSDFTKFDSFTSISGNQFTEIGDSIVLDGKTLESLRLKNGTYDHKFYVITTNINNTMLSTDKKQFQVSVELRDKHQEASISPTVLNYSAEGGTQSVKVTAKGFTRFGYNVSNEYKSWISAKTVKGGTIEITAQPNTTGKERIGYVRAYVCNEEKPTEAQKVYLKDSIKVTQAANKEPEQQESEYELVSGSVNMYYAVLWRWEKSFKLGDDGVTITPSGKGAKVVINQEGTDLTQTWHSTISFEIDDLSLNESNQARISHFRFELEKDVIPYQYYDFHIDSGHELTRMVSPAPKSSYIGGLWTYSKDDLSYYSKSTIHYDKWRKDYYSDYVEHTVETETSEVTDGSSISIGLYIKKK